MFLNFPLNYFLYYIRTNINLINIYYDVRTNTDFFFPLHNLMELPIPVYFFQVLFKIWLVKQQNNTYVMPEVGLNGHLQDAIMQDNDLDFKYTFLICITRLICC